LVDIRPSYRKDKNAAAVRKTEDSPAGKPLFEPIIITIPKPDTVKKTESEGDKKAVDIEPSADVGREKSPAAGVIEKTSDPSKERTPISTDEEKNAAPKASTSFGGDEPSAGESKERPIVIVGNPGKIPQKSTCSIAVSQESI